MNLRLRFPLSKEVDGSHVKTSVASQFKYVTTKKFLPNKLEKKTMLNIAHGRAADTQRCYSCLP